MKKLLAAALLSVVAVPAFAAPAASDGSYYVGVDVGNGKVRPSNCAGGCIAASKDNDTVAGIMLGYQYNKNLAVEVKYTGTGKYQVSGNLGEFKGDAFDLAVVGIAPINDSFSVYGKLGIASNNMKVSGTMATAYQDTRRTAATYGVGAQYNATPTVGIRLGYDHFYGKADPIAAGWTSVDADSDIWTVGAVFKF